MIDRIDKYIEKSNLDSLNPVVAGALLDSAGLLTDSIHRPGLPLRNLLRDGMIPHAFQPGGKGSGWVIPHSGKGGAKGATATPKPRKSKKHEKPLSQKSSAVSPSNPKIMSLLMNAKNQCSVGRVDNMVPDVPGMYCVRLKSTGKLPQPFDQILKERGHNIIYIGIASKSLRRRMLGQELRARGHGTFFRSMGALLGHTPPPGSLIGKRNQKNYKFSSSDNARIIDWMNNHLTVHWEPMSNGWHELEAVLIKQHLPLVNIAKNPARLPELSKLRRRCVEIALSAK